MALSLKKDSALGKLVGTVGKVAGAAGKVGGVAGSANQSSGSVSSKGTSGSSGNKSPSGGFIKYTGGNAELDLALSKYGDAYSQARERALAGDQSAVRDMREANDAANQLRNKYGYAAEFANDDINYVKSKINYYGNGGNGGGGGSGYNGGSVPTAPVDDFSNYLEDMYAAKKKGALSQLEAAYNKNVSALDAARGNLSPGYRDARNQAAANSAMSGRNFAEYAAAAGLNSGAMGQAELARNVALQNDLGSIDRQEAKSLADLELQRTQMETEYNAAIAQAEASGDYELAAALYQEKVRQSEAALQQQMLLYQQQRDAVADRQWQQQFDFNVGQAGTAEKQWQAEMDYKNNAYRDQMQNANRSQLANFGSNFLKNGVMPSQEMLNAMGITAEDARSFIQQLNINASLKAAGNRTAADQAVKDTPSPNYGYQNLVNQLSAMEDRINPNAVPARAAAMIRSAYENGSITENAAQRLLAQYGFV